MKDYYKYNKKKLYHNRMIFLYINIVYFTYTYLNKFVNSYIFIYIYIYIYI